MKNILIKTALLSVITSSMLLASGYRIPEQSTASTAKSAAHVANINSADASYFNPAAMSTLEDISQLESGIIGIYLPPVDFSGTTGSYSSKEEYFGLPYMHYVSPKFDKFRFGLSMVAPGGLSKRWKSPVPKSTAEEFTLTVIELNPSVSYEVNSDFSVGAGLRLIYSDGVVKSNSADISALTGGAVPSAARDMNGNTIEFGYNLALHYHPSDSQWQTGLTYRSNIELKEEGNAKLYLNGVKLYDGGASVTVPLPAVLAFAVAYDITDKTNVEFVIDRTFWSKYRELDFEYKSGFPPILGPAFDAPRAKNWKDVNAYRIGVTHKWDDKLTLMGGFSYDENPIPDAYIGYELPDSDAYLLSFGFDYKVDEKINIGFGYLFDYKQSRSVNNGDINGEFSGGGAHLVNMSLGYKF